MFQGWWVCRFPLLHLVKNVLCTFPNSLSLPRTFSKLNFIMHIISSYAHLATTERSHVSIEGRICRKSCHVVKDCHVLAQDGREVKVLFWFTSPDRLDR